MVDEQRGLGRWAVRGLGILGVFLISLGAIGWWLTTRVLDANGFADVVTISSQRPPVRDYIADQATLKLATSSNFVSSARPVVASAISEAITASPVREAIYDFAAGAHDQIFQITQSKRVNVSSAQAALTVRASLDAINPRLSRKLPTGVLSATTTISQSATVDLLFRAGTWIRVLFIPLFLAGIAVLALTLAKARDKVHAIRAIGVIMAVGGGLLLGIGASTPALSAAAGTNQPGRGEAVAAFIDVLVGRLVGVGRGMIVVGLAVALAPGRDGGDLRFRAERIRAWLSARRTSQRWRFVGGLGLAAVAVMALMVPGRLFDVALAVAGLLLLYVAIVVCLRASGVLVTDHALRRLHKREVALVFAAVIAGFVVTGVSVVAAVSASTEQAVVDPGASGCNGFIELCTERIDQIVWPASHNAMASSAYDFFGAEHTTTVAEQLNAGSRFLMLDAYYGYDDRGLVRTNFAGGVDRKELASERGDTAVRELDRMGALTGAADTSGNKQEVYFCHDFCELGAVHSEDVLTEVRQFLERNLSEVVVLDIEDYVRPKDFRQALVNADLFDRVYIPKDKDELPTLLDMVESDAAENPRRVIVMFEKHRSPYQWLYDTYGLSKETGFTYPSIASFDCAPKRGAESNPFFIVNHWTQSSGLPDPVKARTTNSEKVLTERVDECIETRHALPNAIAVNFTSNGDLFTTVNRLNAAAARLRGVTPAFDTFLDYYAEHPEQLTKAERREARGLKRLPRISDKRAHRLLGDLGDRLEAAPRLDSLIPREVLDRIEAEQAAAAAAEEASAGG